MRLRALHVVTTALLLAGGALSAAPTARAAAPEPSGTQEQKAKELFDSARKEFKAKNYRKAAAGFTTAFEVAKRPSAAYNAARCYELLNERAEAARWYRAYLQAAPGSPDAPAIEEKLRVLEPSSRAPAPEAPPAGAQTRAPAPPSPSPSPDASSAQRPDAPAAQTGTPAGPQPPQVAPSPAVAAPAVQSAAVPGPATGVSTSASSPTRRVVGYPLLGVGAAALIAGIVAGAMANAEHSDALANPPTNVDALERKKADIDAKLWIADGLFIGAAVVGAAGLVLVLTAPQPGPAAKTSLSVAPTVGGGAVVVRGGF